MRSQTSFVAARPRARSVHIKPQSCRGTLYPRFLERIERVPPHTNPHQSGDPGWGADMLPSANAATRPKSDHGSILLIEPPVLAWTG